MEEITIGYLSWKRYNIFQQTLNSHNNNGLFDLIKPENRLIFFQEISDIDIKLAKKYNCNFIGSAKNIGILNAFIELVKKCKTKYFIFCENDWFLIENKDIIEKTLSDCINLIELNNINIVKLRHRKFPGNPLYSKNVWKINNWKEFPYKLESLHWLETPNDIYNNMLDEYNYNYKWYATDLNNQRWSNNIFIAETNYLKSILKLQTFFNNKCNYGSVELNFNNIDFSKFIGQNLDNNINDYINTKIAAGIGLFQHKDYI